MMLFALCRQEYRNVWGSIQDDKAVHDTAETPPCLLRPVVLATRAMILSAPCSPEDEVTCPSGKSAMWSVSAQGEGEVLVVVVAPTHLLASEGDPREKDVSRTGEQNGRGSWLRRVLVSLGPLGAGFSEASASPLQLKQQRGGLLGHVMWHAVSLSFIP